MTDQNLMTSFQAATDRVRIQNFVAPFTATVGMLNNNFRMAYDIAEDQDTKKALVKGLADFVVDVASGVPPNVNSANANVAAVQLLCGALGECVEDKSFIPADFSKRLLTAAHQMLQYTGGGQYNQAVQEAAPKIAAAARQFRAAPAAPQRQQEP